METTDFLRRHVPLFSAVADADLAYIAAAATGRRYAAGASILLRGTTVDGLHIVAGGKAVVHMKIAGRSAAATVELAIGDVFGETSIVEMGVAGATVKAGPEGAAVLVIPQEAFRGLLVRDELFAVHVNTLIRSRKAAAPSAKQTA